MPKLLPGYFTEYEFTEAEMYAATRFSAENKMLIQTLLAQEASRKVLLKVDLSEAPNREQAITAFLQQEAECQGNMSAYQWLLWLAENTEQPKEETSQQKAEVGKSGSQTPTSTGRN